jgi:hypothetical protein
MLSSLAFAGIESSQVGDSYFLGLGHLRDSKSSGCMPSLSRSISNVGRRSPLCLQRPPEDFEHGSVLSPVSFPYTLAYDQSNRQIANESGYYDAGPGLSRRDLSRTFGLRECFRELDTSTSSAHGIIRHPNRKTRPRMRPSPPRQNFVSPIVFGELLDAAYNPRKTVAAIEENGGQ